MGPDHTDDSGGWERAGLHRHLTEELEAQRALVANLTMRLGKRDAALIRAKAELNLREEVALRTGTGTFHAGQDPALELVHAMRCSGPSSVWLTLEGGRKVLIRVAGTGRPDEVQERATNRHIQECGVLPRVAVCGYWVQSMPVDLLGYAVYDRRREIVVNAGLSRQDRRRTRASISASLKAHRKAMARPGLLGLLAPVPLILASMRATCRDLLANSTGIAASTLTTATATVMVTAVAIAPMPPASFAMDTEGPAQGRQRPVTVVADSVPLGSSPRVSSSPRPSVSRAADGASASPEADAALPGDPVVQPLLPTPVPVDTVPPVEQPSPVAEPVPVPDPSPSVPDVTPPTVDPPSPVPEVSELTGPPAVPSGVPTDPLASLDPVEQTPVPEPVEPVPTAPAATDPAGVPSPVPNPVDDGESPLAVCRVDELGDGCPAR